MLLKKCETIKEVINFLDECNKNNFIIYNVIRIDGENRISLDEAVLKQLD